jgi:hypothetical protein
MSGNSPPGAGDERDQAEADEGPSYGLPTVRLRNAAMRLAAELDEARLYPAAAWAAMVADAIEVDAGGATGHEATGLDLDLRFDLDEQGRVWMIREVDCRLIGGKGAVCAAMRSFLACALE